MEENNNTNEKNLDNNFENRPAGSRYEKLGIKSGLTLLGIGAVLVFINISMIIISQKFFPRLLGIGTIAFCYGLAMLIAPGPEVIYIVDSKDKLKELFHEASTPVKVIWTIYIIAGIAGLIIIAVGKTWTSAILFLSALVLVSGIILFIRFLTNYFRKEEEDYHKYVEEEYSYYRPSKRGCLLGMLLGLSVVAAGGYGIYWTGAVDYTIGEIESTINIKKYGHLLSENMDKRIPLYFVNLDQIAPMVSLTSLEDEFEAYQNPEYQEMVTICLGDLIAEILYGKSELDYILLSDDNKIVSFDKEELKKIKDLETQAKEIVLNKALKFNSNKKQTSFIEDNWDIPVVISLPKFNYEYIKVWDFYTFMELYSKLYPESQVTSVDDMLNLFDENDNIPGTRFILCFLDSIDACLWNEETREIGMLINFIDNEYSTYLETTLPLPQYNDNEDEE